MKKQIPTAILALSFVALVAAAIFATIVHPHHVHASKRSSAHAAAPAQCVKLKTTGNAVCLNSTAVKQASAVLIDCVKNSGMTPANCVNGLGSQIERYCESNGYKTGPCTADARRAMSVVLAQATGKPISAFSG